MRDRNRFQRRAQWLGWLGLLPFLGGTLLILSGVKDAWVIEGLRNYAAIILSFIGAIHWGRALHMDHAGLASFSIWPALYAWVCLFLPLSLGFPLLASGFLLLLLIDQQQYRAITTSWFRRLRIQLSLSVSGLLLLSWSVT